ncbi:hypothetical protein SAMN05421688_0801 [Poseidonocella pacifica]|uniref:Uncharacterized protein n=1 Tax=Poseidonocella pacifica TaxID=871651 RepID=A0A1I0VQ41_9RHOB|nr:hypothetical protein SAMN05421688_0801 [Poseidonocella pacifica]
MTAQRRVSRLTLGGRFDAPEVFGLSQRHRTTAGRRVTSPMRPPAGRVGRGTGLIAPYQVTKEEVMT